MLRQEKHAFVDEVRQEVERSAGVVLVDYTGLKVQQVDVIRRKCRELKLSYRVVKNTLMARVLAGTSYEDAGSCLKGTPTGVVIGFDDPVSTAKVAFDFAKEFEKLRIKGGIVEGKAISAKEAESLSKMPSKPEIQATVVGQIMAPGRKLVAQFMSPGSKILGAIMKLVENKEKSDQ
jgi:large subunit ribosomal protein L10